MSSSRLPQDPATKFKAVHAPRPAVWGDVESVKANIAEARAQLIDILTEVEYKRPAQELIDTISPFMITPPLGAVESLSSQFLLGATQLVYETGMAAMSKLGNVEPAVVDGEVVKGAVVGRSSDGKNILMYHVELLCRTLHIYQMYEAALARERAGKN